MTRCILIIFSILYLFPACRIIRSNKQKNRFTKEDTNIITLLEKNKEFIRDSLIQDKSGIIDYYFSTYISDTCDILIHDNSILRADFEGIEVIKGIRTNKLKDTVFVMQGFSICESTESYVFFDKSLPRLFTDSYCCQPINLFVVDDIDEDGINEIGIYYSTCVSRYKSLRIYSLKQSVWVEIGNSTFDIFTQEPSLKNFEKSVYKINKNSFAICNYYDHLSIWDTITMN